MFESTNTHTRVLGLALIFGISASSWAGSMINLSYNGSVDADSILPALTVDKAAPFVFTAEGIDGTGGTGIPNPTLQLLDVNNNNNPLTDVVGGCTNNAAVEAVIGRPLDADGACILAQLPPGAYALKVVDASGASGNVLASITEDLDGSSSGPGNSEVTPGLWTGGNPDNKEPFFACLNVSADGTKITLNESACLVNNDLFALGVIFEGGMRPDGDECADRAASVENIPIVNNSFTYTLNTGQQIFRITGTFSGNTVNGRASVESSLFFEGGEPVTCSINWNATPEVLR